jgi:hypothetical protein
MELQQADLVTMSEATRESDWAALKLSKKTLFDRDEVQGLMEETSRLLPLLKEELEGLLGPEKMGEMRNRHLLLEEGLRGTTMTRRTAKLFPQDQAGEIMEWYVRLVAGLRALWELKRRTRQSAELLGDFIPRYPGPEVEEKKHAWRNELEHYVLGKGSHRSKEVGRREVNMESGTEASRRSEAREDPATSGYNFRLGGAPAVDVSKFLQGGTHSNPRSLSSAYVKPRSKKAREEYFQESVLSSAQGSARSKSRPSEYDEDSDEEGVAGFEGMDREEILEEITSYAETRLEEEGCQSHLALQILIENFPEMNLLGPKLGKEDGVTSKFARLAKEIAPQTDGGLFISMSQWWLALNNTANDNGWSIPSRVRFLYRTGGLTPLPSHSNFKEQAMNLMKVWKDWLPQYETSRRAKDNRYWFTLWIDIGVKFISEFHTVQHTEEVERGVEKMLEAKKYDFTSIDDPLNEDFPKVLLAHQDMVRWLTERSSNLVDSPLYVYGILKKWLLKQGKDGVGQCIIKFIDSALRKLSTSPESVFPIHHRRTAKQLTQIRREGAGQASMTTYRLILEELKRKAQEKSLEYSIFSLKQLGRMTGNGDFEKGKADKKKERKAANALVAARALVAGNVGISTDFSTLTVNSVATPAYPPPCDSCGLYHEMSKGCLFYNKETKVFGVGNFIKHRAVRQINGDGTSVLNPFWMKKLDQYAWKAMGITNEDDRKKIVKDLKAAIARLPEATVAERRAYAEQHKRFVNLSTAEGRRLRRRRSARLLFWRTRRTLLTLMTTPRIRIPREPSTDREAAGLSVTPPSVLLLMSSASHLL